MINLREAINEIMIINACNKGINPLLHNLLGEAKLRFIRLIKQNYENLKKILKDINDSYLIIQSNITSN